MKSTEENLLLWEQRIKERVQSGITIKEWCKRNRVSKQQYYYWKHRIEQNQKPGEEDPFAEVTPLLSSGDIYRQGSTTVSNFQMFFHDIRIEVPSNFNPDALAGLIKILREL